tara:strand:- start:115555 stop:116835 length:1281 start_codon:yes stop_codon:yes gene_type:complete
MMTPFSEKEIDRLSHASDLLVAANLPLKVLQSIAWSKSVGDTFFAHKAKELPIVEYPQIDVSASLDAVTEARKFIQGDSPVHEWLSRIADNVAETAYMLSSLGTPAFYEHSKNLFGTPKKLLWDGKHTALDLAEQQDKTLSRFNHYDLVDADFKTLTAKQVRALMRPHIKKHFGDQAPTIEIVEDLSAKAVAGTRSIKLRKSAPFTDLDARQLLTHEAHIHIATTLNGEAQDKFKILSSSHAGSTKTQEGLAVFSEIVSGVMDPIRMKRLSDRVMAIQLAIDGADFLDVYKFFLERSPNEFEAFENSRRVMRGGVMSGGAPFTKDGVYLEGLLRVHNFLQVTIPTGNTVFLNLLFCGKLDLDDVEALMMLNEQGLLTPPKFMPPWARDKRFLVSMLSYSKFLHQIDFDVVHEKYESLIQMGKDTDK